MTRHAVDPPARPAWPSRPFREASFPAGGRGRMGAEARSAAGARAGVRGDAGAGGRGHGRGDARAAAPRGDGRGGVRAAALGGDGRGGVRAAAPRGGTAAPAEAPVAPERVEEPVTGEEQTTDRPWVVVVWNDPVNLMSYVVFVFQKLFGYSREKATRLMLQVHHEGRAAVSHGPREKAEADVARLHAHGLWATMQRDS